MMKRLYRSSQEKKVAGICGGLGELFEVDPNLIRLGLILLALATGVIPVLITYIVGWMILPKGMS